MNDKSNQFYKYRLLFENSISIILFINENGDIVEANPSALKAYGYTADEMSRLNIRQLREVNSIGAFETQFQQAISTGVYFETVHKRKNGSTFPVEVSSTACIIDQSKIIMSIIRDISVRKELETKLYHLANYDFLTGIPNRSHVIGRFTSMCEEATSKQERLAILSFDIDKFKHVNDSYGHKSGDIVLKELSSRVADTTTGLFGRVGGDEFVILQPFAQSREELIPLIERISDVFELPIDLNGVLVRVDTSIGISIFPDDSVDIDRLLIFADHAMYQAKRLSGNTYIFYSDLGCNN